MTKYQIVVDSELWEEFKGTVPKTLTINDIIVDMIEKRTKNPKFQRRFDI